uniref:8-hydroxygeraniol oxidase n=1 Tax=Phaedon cochleariae TaxID=80249 RepID=W4VSE0_PHACE
MLLKCCLIFFVMFIAGNTTITHQYYSEEDFIRMVRDNITAANAYVLPQDNSVLIGDVRNERCIHDYGTFDFIIVGGGSAGTLLANRLSEIADWKILLLEAGGPENDFSDIPGLNAFLMFSDMNWGYYGKPQSQACLGMRNNSCVAPRGKVLGGSSVINAKQFVRGNKEDYNLWEAMGNAGWSYNDVLQYFKKFENYHIYNADPFYHGTTGPLDVGYTEPTIMTEAYIYAMRELGYPWVDFNGKNQIGSSQAILTIKGNKAATGGRAFIDPIIMRRPNLNVTLNAFVTRVLITHGTRRANGVRFIRNGEIYEARASREVILSAGAYNTPQLLMLSGIGPRSELRRHNISMIEDLPVGRNFQDHPMFIGLVFKTNQSLFNESFEDTILGYLNSHRPLTTSFNIDSLGFINVNDSKSTVPDIEHMVMAPPGWNSPAIISRVQNLNEETLAAYFREYNPHTDLVFLTVLLHEKSRGSVTLRSNNPRDFPIIDYNYLTDRNGYDIDTFYKGIEHTLKLLETDAFKAINASVISVVAGCDEHAQFSRDYWYCAIRQLITTVYHPVGTTRMGNSRHNSVVSNKLIVHGMENLRVVDAGVMPEIPSGNVLAATYMIAEKISDDIKLHYRQL